MIGNEIIKEAFKEEIIKDDVVPFFEGHVMYKDMILEIFVKSAAIEEACKKLFAYPKVLNEDPADNDHYFKVGPEDTAWSGKYGYILNTDFLKRTKEGYNQNWGALIHYQNSCINLNILNVVGLAEGVTFREGALLKPAEVLSIRDSLNENVKYIYGSYMKSCYHKLVMMRTDLAT